MLQAILVAIAACFALIALAKTQRIVEERQPHGPYRDGAISRGALRLATGRGRRTCRAAF